MSLVDVGRKIVASFTKTGIEIEFIGDRFTVEEAEKVGQRIVHAVQAKQYIKRKVEK